MKSRISNRPQLSTDGNYSCLEAVADTFGGQIDFAQIVKLYGPDKTEDLGTNQRRGRYKGSIKTVISGTPDPDHMSTSYLERQNLTMRMSIRRMGRQTNAFSKKVENYIYAIALHFVHYNFVRRHKTIRVTPAMAAKLTKRFMTIEDIVGQIDLLPIKKETCAESLKQTNQMVDRIRYAPD